MTDGLDRAAVLWIAALDRVPIEEQIDWVQAMLDRVEWCDARRGVNGQAAKHTSGSAATESDPS